MITCDICGTLNFKENNYCTHCGNKLILAHTCPVCGESNTDLATHCIKCKSQLNPIIIDDFDVLFSEFNQNLLLNAQVSDEEYNQILKNIFVRADYVEVWGDTIKNKILNFAKIFTECKPKSRGYERGYIFSAMEFIMMTGWTIQFKLQLLSMNSPIICFSPSLKVCCVTFLRLSHLQPFKVSYGISSHFPNLK